jgi:hypothetical protein
LIVNLLSQSKHDAFNASISASEEHQISLATRCHDLEPGGDAAIFGLLCASVCPISERRFRLSFDTSTFRSNL